MTFVPAGVAALVTAYCLGCVARPGWRDPGSGAGLAVGHVVMGATTLAMAVGALSAGWATALLGVFAAAILGCAIRGAATAASRSGYLRLGVRFAAMLPMLMPAAATAATAAGTAAPTATAVALASTVRSSHHMPMPDADIAGWSASSAGRVIDLLLIGALLALAAARLADWSRAGLTLHCRLHTMCEVAMAATTGCMLAAML
jgi:hypothetical protein